MVFGALAVHKVCPLMPIVQIKLIVLRKLMEYCEVMNLKCGK